MIDTGVPGEMSLIDLEAGQKMQFSDERLFSAIFRASPIPIALEKLPDGVLIDVNESWESFTGYSRDEAIGNTSIGLSLVHPTERDAAAQRLWKEGTLRDFEIELRHKSGRTIKALIAAELTEIGGHPFALSLAVDITERKRMEEELRKSHDELEQRVKERAAALIRLDAAVENARNSIMVAEDFKMVFVNPAFCEMLGYSRTELIGNDMSMLRDRTKPKGYYENRRKDIIENNRESGVLALERKDGKVIQVESYFSRIPGTTTTVVISNDITEKLLLEEELRQAHKMEAIGTLAGGIAHDFNNMLAVIIGNAELAIDDNDLNAIRGNLKQILTASKRSRDLVKQILAFSKKNGGTGKAARIAPVVEETYDLLRASLPTTIHIELKLRAKKDVTVPLESSQIQQILVNLANNAAHAMRENGGSLTISLSTVGRPRSLIDHDSPTGYVKLEVEDTGTGMTQEIQQHIFEPFYTTKEAGQGTGMGLSVVYGIVHGCEGTIDVESEPGRGSTFVVLLPRTDTPSVAEDDEPHSTAYPLDHHVLFVDDEPAVLEVGKATLERLGCRVTTARSSTEALKLFTENPEYFDLVITDHTMPGMTGLTLSQKLLGIKEDARIVLCTGYSEMVSEEKAKEAGVRQFLMKPITKGQLAEVIRKVLHEG